MKKTMRKAMISTICMLVVAVMSLTGVTYAWFSASTTADVTGMTMNVAAADGGLQVRKDSNASWGSLINFDSTKDGMKPVSTINAVTFYSAIVNPNDEDQIKTAEDSANVWTETFQAKNTGYGDITVTLANTTETPIFIDNTDGLKDSSQAARVAIFTKLSTQSEYTLAYIYTAGENNTGIKGASGDAYFNYRTNSDAADGNTAADETYVGTVTGNKTSQQDCKFTLPGLNEDTGAETIVDIKVVVWIEGQDAQCVNQNAGSSFKVDLDFAATAATSN